MSTTSTVLHGITVTPVESSRIVAIGHAPESNTLAIQFKRGDAAGPVYHYQNVDAEQFQQFQGAESIGSHFYKHIKPFAEKFPYQKMD
ncbi:KTSC domain-containing protein [Massilia sp. CFBP9012]|uniref:KTSC domain-containing protein n=1 Tax=Massilia sp. CFBP9012 TaxID=3096531 RepID=UPI002A6ABE71|nr:KTSC domain-containing protein [Massilia sp. CFBP9012]MDY0975024.1 KTSC domain-containing protein [Massilia sp. CFBP9012]